ncbi:calpastatin isoform X7 [Gallus gallus]|uniref:calpastatin isoform X7 n=1 Tax=Gallus gallus TaxID=9031 RepID=UPI001F02DAC2|nr:calpastatin isoform X7 [Gallus gallus]XP_046790959.1 calpastatin isoform X7 [Gallus gallus]
MDPDTPPPPCPARSPAGTALLRGSVAAGARPWPLPWLVPPSEGGGCWGAARASVSLAVPCRAVPCGAASSEQRHGFRALVQGDKKASGTSSKSGEKKEATEKPAGANVSQLPKTQTSGVLPAAKKQSPSADAPKPPIMKPSEAKSTPTIQTEPEKTALSTKPSNSQNNQPAEEKPKESSGAKSPIAPSVVTASKPNNMGKETTSQAERPSQATSADTAQPKTEKTSTAGGAGAAGAGAVASMVAAADKPNSEPAMDESALDSLIDTLGGSEEDVATRPVYTGPEITENISSEYLEELGKREGSLPPEYLALLKSKVDGKDGGLPKVDEHSEKPMTDDELADALSSDFTCSIAAAEEKKTTEKQTKEGEIIQAQVTSSVKTSVPPKEKKTKSKEEIKEDAMEALMATIGGPEPEPEPKDVSPIVEVSEAKAKEKKEKKAGERDDTIPPEYRLTPELDKDGKPVLPKPEEKPKPLSESDLVDEFSKDFASPAQPAVQSKPSKPSNTSKKPSAPASTKTAKDEVVPRATACSVQSSAPTSVSSVGHVADEAVEALSSSLGEREPDPEEKKPAVDKVKDKDGRPLLIKPEEESQPMSENDLLEGLTKGFSPAQSAPLPTQTVKKKTKGGKKTADSSDVISASTISSVHSAAPLASTSGGKEMDDALDLLSDSLGQREPDPDENKPVVDKVKEKAKSEHRDKLGERDDTIPPDYRKLLESSDEGKPVKPTPKDASKNKEQKKPTDESAAIDALSGDFDTSPKAPATPQHSKCRRKVERKPSPLKQPQRMKENPRIIKRQGDSPPAANLRSRKQAKR